jgi:hypothetical protein
LSLDFYELTKARTASPAPVALKLSHNNINALLI